jgi:hypothetical protein
MTWYTDNTALTEFNTVLVDKEVVIAALNGFLADVSWQDTLEKVSMMHASLPNEEKMIWSDSGMVVSSIQDACEMLKVAAVAHGPFRVLRKEAEFIGSALSGELAVRARAAAGRLGIEFK